MGRPRKYANDAERQAAYRYRKEMQELEELENTPQPITLSAEHRWLIWNILNTTKGTQARRLAQILEHHTYQKT